MKPSDVVLTLPPLTAVFGNAEAEQAAALLVWYCQTHGDEWQLVLPKDLGHSLADAFDKEPVKSWGCNPFFRPNMVRLSKDGFVTKLDGSIDQPVGFTELGLQRLRDSMWNRNRL